MQLYVLVYKETTKFMYDKSNEEVTKMGDWFLTKWGFTRTLHIAQICHRPRIFERNHLVEFYKWN